MIELWRPTSPAMIDGTIDCWLRVVDYDDGSVVLRGADSTEARFTFEEVPLLRGSLPDRGELARFRVNYELFCASGLRLRTQPHRVSAADFEAMLDPWRGYDGA